MSEVFISYTRGDSVWCRRFYDDLSRKLRSLGGKSSIYLAEASNLPGVHWRDLLESMLRQSPFFLVVVSRDSAHSTWVREETEEALALQRSQPERVIIPILISAHSYIEEINKELLNYHIADFSNPDNYEEMLVRIAYVIHHPDTLRNAKPGVIPGPPATRQIFGWLVGIILGTR